MSIIKSIFKVMKNGAWDEHYFKTSSDQVVHTKTDGQASTVKEQLDGLNSALNEKSVVAEVYFNGDLIQTDDGYCNIPISSHNDDASQLLTFGTWQFYFKESGKYFIIINAYNTGDYSEGGVFGACLGRNREIANELTYSLTVFPQNGMTRRVSSSFTMDVQSGDSYNLLYYNNKPGQHVIGRVQIIKIR